MFGRIATEEKKKVFPALLAKITKGQIHHAFVRPGPWRLSLTQPDLSKEEENTVSSQH